MEENSEEIWKALRNTMHPEIDSNLVELKMIKNVVVKGNKATVTLALPFLGVPIRDYLVDTIRKTIMKLGMEADVEITEMNRKELQRFLNTAREKWRGI